MKPIIPTLKIICPYSCSVLAFCGFLGMVICHIPTFFNSYLDPNNVLPLFIGIFMFIPFAIIRIFMLILRIGQNWFIFFEMVFLWIKWTIPVFGYFAFSFLSVSIITRGAHTFEGATLQNCLVSIPDDPILHVFSPLECHRIMALENRVGTSLFMFIYFSYGIIFWPFSQIKQTNLLQQ